MANIRVFTREPIGEEYPEATAHSVHFALIFDELNGDAEKEVILNQNYGILFPKARIREDNTLEERGIIAPKICEQNGVYYICAEQVDHEGNPVLPPETKVITWRTNDFVNFEEYSDADCDRYAEMYGKTEATAECDQLQDTDRISLSDHMQIADELLPGIKERWIPLRAESVSLSEKVEIRSWDELKPNVEFDSKDSVGTNPATSLKNLRGCVTYSDGSVDYKPIIWNLDSKQKVTENTYRIQGKMSAIHTGFPLTVGLADPVIFHWKDKWYYIATNDNVDDIGIFVRQSDSVSGLFTDGIETKCILDYDEERELCQTFWAPEFHVIGGRLYILFAVSNHNWGPQSHMMRLKEDGDIMNPNDWEDPIRVKRMDGHFLTENGITLDMTYFEAAGKSYLAWSYRYGIGTPLDTGSMLYIATTDPKTPWILTSEPVLLSRPLYGWENQSGTVNNEGPYPLILGDNIYLAYSGGAACGCSYVVGYLKAKVGDDLLNLASWKKEPTPVLHLQSIEGIQGPGHNSFFYDEDGRLMIAYHAQEREKHFCRCSAFHRVHISKSGFPLLNVEGERDLPEELSEVSIEVVVSPSELK